MLLRFLSSCFSHGHTSSKGLPAPGLSPLYLVRCIALRYGCRKRRQPQHCSPWRDLLGLPLSSWSIRLEILDFPQQPAVYTVVIILSIALSCLRTPSAPRLALSPSSARLPATASAQAGDSPLVTRHCLVSL
jgi:hypothetical protein